ncbi:cytochrome P450 2B4-like isoform 1-T1 [Discoglossus pictus]
MDIFGSITLILIFFLSSLLLYSAVKTRESFKGLPPGPSPLPLLGNILQIERGKLVQSLLRMSDKYGPVFTVYFGTRRVVVLKGYQAIKEALVDQGDEFSGRGEMPAFDKCFQNTGIIFTNDMEGWRLLRRFTFMTFRDFGMGKRIIEDWIHEENQHLISEFRKTNGTVFNPTILLSLASMNVICCILFGHRFKYDDEEFISTVEVIHESLKLISCVWGQMYDLFPSVMQYVPGKHHGIFRCLNSLITFSERKVEMVRQKLDPTCPQNYIDTFLIKMEKEKENPETEFTEQNLVSCVAQIIYASADTASMTLSYGFLLLIKYHQVQVKVQEEIAQVVGHNRTPTLQDKMNMPYTDAVIHEIQRFINLIPFGAPRAVTKDVTLKGYFIPKGTNIFALLGSALNDPQCWQDPNNFNPQNFLDEFGKFKKNGAFMPFSAGKRSCLGEGPARMQLFLFLTTILQNFNLKSNLPTEDIDITPQVTGLVNIPKYYEMYLECR